MPVFTYIYNTIDPPLTPKYFCVSEISSFLLFATKRDVRRLSLDSRELADVVISLSNVSSAIGVEYDSDTDSIYWSDLDADIIGHATWNGSTEEVAFWELEVFHAYLSNWVE